MRIDAVQDVTLEDDDGVEQPCRVVSATIGAWDEVDMIRWPDGRIDVRDPDGAPCVIGDDESAAMRAALDGPTMARVKR